MDAWKHLKFKDDETGLRMAYRVIKTYRRRYRIHTIEHLCGRWVSPRASWADKQNWIRTVLKRTRTKPGQKLDFSDPDMAKEIVRGIVYAENSCDDIDPAVYAAVFQ